MMAQKTKKPNIFKRIGRWIKREIIWFFSDKVVDAINNGVPYEEVKKMVDEEVDKKIFKRR